MQVRTRPRRYSRRRIAIGAAVVLAATAALAAGPVTSAHAAIACDVDYNASPWTEQPGIGGFTAHITINNLEDPVNGWTLAFTLPTGQSLDHGWAANWPPPGTSGTLTATDLGYNANLGTGGSTTIGFNGRWTGSYSDPASFTLNGVTCDGGGGENQPPTATLTSPTAGASFPQGQAVPLAATATDPDGTINRVEFYVDGALVATDTSAPYTASATGLSVGPHSAFARAFDNGSPQLSADSDTALFTVTTVGMPSITLSPSSLTVAEGGSAPLVVRLSEAPASTVNVALARTGDADITVSPTSVSLNAGNWSSGVTATVSAAEDADQSNGTATITATATGYNPGSASVTEDDNDGGTGGKVDNPFAGADGYVNPQWAAQVLDEAGQHTGDLADDMEQVATYSTAVWMDRRAAIDPPEGMGLADHLNEAVQQDAANGGTPLAIQIVIYDLPNRDCAALASNGELRISENGLNLYRDTYIDPIRDILDDAAYANLRLVLIVEPDSLPNMVTNTSGQFASPDCIEAQQTGAYRDGIRYALSEFATLPNAYAYLDIAHSGWLGWPNNFDGALNEYDATIDTPNGPGWDTVHGFITNTANYTPLEEIFLPNPQLQVGGQQVMSSTFYEFNPRFDERDFAVDLRNAFVGRGASPDIGMLIDTSRNGWGGPDRPTAVSTSNDLNTYVNESKIDRRPHRGGWCNQDGAGIGERPTGNTGIAGVDAFVWVKPPGESDGVSEPGIIDPQDPNKGFDAMCDPDAQNRYNNTFPTNALPDAPHAGGPFVSAGSLQRALQPGACSSCLLILVAITFLLGDSLK